jgi:HK97 gp10 family phage protein
MARFKGVKSFKRIAKELSEETQQEVKGLVRDTTLAIEADAKRNSPVDTGYLKRHIKSELAGGGNRGIVTSDADYSGYVEWGTSRTPAQPFFFPAVSANARDFNAKLKQIVKKG